MLGRKLPAVEREHRMEEPETTFVWSCSRATARAIYLRRSCSRKKATSLPTYNWSAAHPVNGRSRWGRAKKQLSLDSEKDQTSQISSTVQSYRPLRPYVEEEWPWLSPISSPAAVDLTFEGRPANRNTRPTLQQIPKADRQVFMCLIRIGVQLKRLPDNKLDLDSKLFPALQSYEVGFHLLPLPKSMPPQVQQPSTQSTASQGSNVVSRCGAVRILCTKWAGVVARWPFWIVTWSPVVARCEFCEQSGLRSLQGDFHVAGVIWKGRRWRFEDRRRACRVAGGAKIQQDLITTTSRAPNVARGRLNSASSV